MELKILPPLVGVRPRGIQPERLLPKLAGHAEAFPCPEARDSLAPIRVLALTSGRPIAIHECANVACQHRFNCTADSANLGLVWASRLTPSPQSPRTCPSITPRVIVNGGAGLPLEERRRVRG